MAFVIKDTVRDLEIQEREGSVIFLRRGMLITDLTSKSLEVFEEAGQAEGMPRAGSVHEIYNNTILRDRTFRLVEGDNTKVRATLTYVGLGEDEQVGFFVPETSLQQISTNTDIFGNEITTTHTYPSGHDTFGGETITQGATISALTPITEIHRTIKLKVTDMTTFSQQWVGSVNFDTWGGASPGTWLCSGMNATLIDSTTSPDTFKIEFFFQFDPRGWDPIVTHIDPTTGQPPPNLVQGVGIKTITHYKRAIFNQSYFNII